MVKEIGYRGEANKEPHFQKFQQPFKKREIGKKADRYCNHCKAPGHRRETCFKIHGFSDWYKKMHKKRAGQTSQAFATPVTLTPFEANTVESNLMNDAVISNMVLQEVARYMKAKMVFDPSSANCSNFAGTDPNWCFLSKSDYVISSWIIDTGASNHICSNLSYFSHILTLPIHSNVHLPDGTKQLVTQFGTVILHPCLTLTNILYIPSFKYNLLSVYKLLKLTDISISFSSTSCTLQEQWISKVIAYGKEKDGLYILNASSFCLENNSVTVFSKIDTCNLWHLPLGHVPKSVLSKITEINASYGDNFLSDVCPLSKQHRLPFSISVTNTNCIFELIHVDLWGSSYQQPSFTGAQYILTIVDDHSRTTSTYLL